MKAVTRMPLFPMGANAKSVLFFSLLLLIASTSSPNKAVAASLEVEQRCLALNLYWEARGEDRSGMIAVGWVVLNRMRSPHFPSTPCGVVYQGGERPPCEFSWWCDGKSDRPGDQRSWQRALIAAADLLVKPPPDPTGGALYYHSTSIRRPWSRVRTVQIGRHVFYR